MIQSEVFMRSLVSGETLNTNTLSTTIDIKDDVLGAGGYDSAIRVILRQPDEKLLIAGDFNNYDDTSNYLIRLNEDKTLDTEFNTNVGFNFSTEILTIALQPDGKVLVGGGFTYTGETLNYLVRLNSDGTPDTEFNTNIGTNFNDNVNVITLQPDGKILVGGAFTNYGGVDTNYLVRLNSDGTPDTSFNSNILDLDIQISGPVISIAVQYNDNILIATTTNFLFALISDGTYNLDFNTNIDGKFNSLVRPILIQPDNKILVGGDYIDYNGIIGLTSLIRLNSDGTDDNDFNSNVIGMFTSTGIYSLGLQPNGKIFVGGDFTNYNNINNFVRINPDGTDDVLINDSLKNKTPAVVRTMLLNDDYEGLFGGDFLDFNNQMGQINYGVALTYYDNPYIYSLNSFTVLGNSNDMVTVNLNGFNMELPGGTTYNITPINNITVGRCMAINSSGTYYDFDPNTLPGNEVSKKIGIYVLGQKTKKNLYN